MGKTYRYSPDDRDFGFQEHRISRRDKKRVAAIAARHITTRLAPVVIVPEHPTFFDASWIPAKSLTDKTEVWLAREERLDLIQALGEQMLL